MQYISLDTSAKEQLIDITSQVREIVSRAGTLEGVVQLWCLHTTAALTVNENADPDVQHDLLMALERIVSFDWPYRHAEGNSPAHIKSSLLGCQLAVPVSDGQLALGSWQGIQFAEFDGPRRGRRVALTVVPAVI
jgi:secondary thiamine-phosphate synthase enzyme